ncbi:MAG TPA: HAMP domain-containing sensor histidine kinase [Rhodocyclaceae bacterium]|nr:HAMP domain-containing sensor histidine kinase [Rhodocyclaceae bacterium]
MLTSADSLARTLSKTLFPTLLHDELWKAYEILNAPFHGASPASPMQASVLVLLDRQDRVFVSTHPEEFPTLSRFGELGREAERVETQIGALPGGATREIRIDDSSRIWVAAPVQDDDERLGTLLIAYPTSALLARFVETAWRAIGIAVLVLAILLPINWYWGRRMAVPLTSLAVKLSEMRHRLPEDDDLPAYTYDDELGRLFFAYRKLLVELREADRLKDEFVKGQRLAAVGRLAASIAHEINNPLAGMLTAIDTIKQRGALDPRDAKTVGLLERSLAQIKDTVKALLVEAKTDSRNLNPGDIDDIRTLLHASIANKTLDVEWHCDIDGDIPVSANLVRQVLINILINAIQATGTGGHVIVSAGIASDNLLRIEVANDGARLSEEIRAHMFEPFTTSKETGHGLGLWVTYQIVQQMGGTIRADDDGSLVKFTVEIPVREQWKTQFASA